MDKSGKRKSRKRGQKFGHYLGHCDAFTGIPHGTASWFFRCLGFFLSDIPIQTKHDQRWLLPALRIISPHTICLL